VRSRSLVRWILAVAGAATGLSLALARGEAFPALAVAGALAAGHLFPLRSAGGRLQPLSPAVAAAAAFAVPALPALCGFALGLPAGWLAARARFGEAASADLLPGESAGAAAFAAVVAGLAALFPEAHEPWERLVMLIPAGGAWHLASSGVRTGWTEMRSRLAAGLLWRSALGDWPPYVVLVTTGALYGLTRESMGWWAVLLAAMPYAFTHLAFDRLATTAATYEQTIRALGRVPEVGGFGFPGHAERSADLAVAIGGELGLSPAETRRVEHAALLADIGRVVPAGSSAAGDGAGSPREVAEWSAAIVGEAPALRPVAAIVGQSPRPYRRPGEERDPGLPASAQVVKVAATYDCALGRGLAPVDALEELHRGTAYDYDPEVVAALRRVLVRRGCPGI
jgi:hypothetical protein